MTIKSFMICRQRCWILGLEGRIVVFSIPRWLTRPLLVALLHIHCCHPADFFRGPAGGGGRLWGRRRRQDAVHHHGERAAWRQRHQLPGPRGRGGRRLHLTSGRAVPLQEQHWHEAVQPARRHHVGPPPATGVSVQSFDRGKRTHLCNLELQFRVCLFVFFYSFFLWTWNLNSLLGK